MNPSDTSILLIYTGGTIGMIENPETGALENFNFEQLQKHVPELQKFTFPIDSYQFAYGLFGHGTGSLEETGTRHQ